MRHLVSLVLVGAMVGGPGVATASWLDVPLTAPLTVAHPALGDACGFWRTLEQLARQARVRVGLEHLATCPPGGWGLDPGDGALRLDGMTLREASDHLAALRPEFDWREVGGVIVFRPAAAWRLPSEPLHRTVAPFTVERVHPHLALHAVMAAARPLLAYPHDDVQLSSLGRRRTDAEAIGLIDMPIDVNFRGGSLLDALNAITQSFDGIWQVGYSGRLLHIQVQTPHFHEGSTSIVAPIVAEGEGRR